MKKILYFAIVILIGIGLIVGYFVINNSSFLGKKSKASADLVDLSITPASREINTFDPLAFPITIASHANRTTAIEFEITYDQNKFDFDKIEPTAFFPDPVVLSPAHAENGILTYVLGDRPTDTRKGQDGSGIVATLTLKPKANIFNITSQVSTQISMTQNTKVAVIGKDTDTKGDLANATVIIKPIEVPATPTPTTPVNSPTPTPTIPVSTITSTPTPTPIPLIGDINHDGKVDILDYRDLIINFGRTRAQGFLPSTIDPDIVRNDIVDIFDYRALILDFGKTQ